MPEDSSGPRIPRMRSKFPGKQATSKAKDIKDWFYLRYLSVKRWIEGNLSSILAYGTGLFGWFGVTYGLHLVIGHPSVFWLSGGLLFLTGLGWRTVADLAWDGFYTKWLRTQQESEG